MPITNKSLWSRVIALFCSRMILRLFDWSSGSWNPIISQIISQIIYQIICQIISQCCISARLSPRLSARISSRLAPSAAYLPDYLQAYRVVNCQSGGELLVQKFVPTVNLGVNSWSRSSSPESIWGWTPGPKVRPRPRVNLGVNSWSKSSSPGSIWGGIFGAEVLGLKKFGSEVNCLTGWQKLSRVNLGRPFPTNF